MMRVAVVADSHFSEDSRFEECIEVHRWIANDVKERGLDLLLHAGDLFQKKSSPVERLAAASWLRLVADHCPVLCVRGNHDAVQDLPLFTRLRAPHKIYVEEASGIHRFGALAVLALAWPKTAELAAAAGLPGEGVTAAEALRSLLSELRSARAGGPAMVLAHAQVCGSVTSLGQPLAGCDLELGLADLAQSEADFVALGHIHKPQEWQVGKTVVAYAGSPRRTAFGEVEEKSYMIVELDGRGVVSWTRVSTPARQLVQLDLDAATPQDISSAAGGEVLLRFSTDPDSREQRRRLATTLRDALLAAGATSVKLEEQVVVHVRARAPEVAAATTLNDKMRAFWKAKQTQPSPEREQRLLHKLHLLDDEARHEAE